MPFDNMIFDRANENDEYEIEIQHETGNPGKYKLYIHSKSLGITMVRICKLKAEDIKLPDGKRLK